MVEQKKSKTLFGFKAIFHPLTRICFHKKPFAAQFHIATFCSLVRSKSVVVIFWSLRRGGDITEKGVRCETGAMPLPPLVETSTANGGQLKRRQKAQHKKI